MWDLSHGTESTIWVALLDGDVSDVKESPVDDKDPCQSRGRFSEPRIGSCTQSQGGLGFRAYLRTV